MKQEEAVKYTERCFNGEPATCMRACPFSLDIRSFLEKTEKGRWAAAYKLLRNATVFPIVSCALCPAPCKENCQRTQIGDAPIEMSLIEDACIRYAKSRKPDNYVIPPKKERIAVIGAGLAGLTSALLLAQKKFSVTVFEKSDKWGGSLRTHPRFEDFSEDFELQFSAAVAEILFNREITSLEELRDFDLIYVATGKDGNDFGLLKSWDERLMTTEQNRVFLGGSLTGANPQISVVQGLRLSKTAEVFLQTGKAAETFGPEKNGCAQELNHSGEPSVAVVKPSNDEYYTENEARSESARCFQCDCNMCIQSCEMLSTFRKKPKKLAVEVYTDTQVNPPFSSHTLTRQAYSCNMCGNCKHVCPEDTDIGGLLRLSRIARAESEVYPEALHDFWLREMDFATGEASFFSAAKDADKCEYLFFPGCQLTEHNPQHVYESYKFLHENYNAGIFLGCCGAPAYWAGDNKRQNENFQRISEAWKDLGMPNFVFACATCESLFAQFLPEIARVSIYGLLGKSEDIRPNKIYETASVFDPCNARENKDIEAAVRKIAQQNGIGLTELPEKNRCCGYGGHIRIANPELYDKVTGNRAGISSNPYIVYCANCREVFKSRGKECAHILDIAFNLPHDTKIPAIEQKRINAIAVKKEFMKILRDEDFIPAKNPWDDMTIKISDAVYSEIDNKLISLNEVKEAIYRAEESGDMFYEEESGIYRCSIEKAVMTYWVTYKRYADAYEIIEAYSHRMKFSKEEARG